MSLHLNVFKWGNIVTINKVWKTMISSLWLPYDVLSCDEEAPGVECWAGREVEYDRKPLVHETERNWTYIR